MKNKEVLILCTCDAWHSIESQKIVACFTDYQDVDVFVRDNIKELKQEDIDSLLIHNQTQGLEQNYVVLTERLNPDNL